MEARVVIDGWLVHYNDIRAHSSLNYQTPNEFKKTLGNYLTTGADFSSSFGAKKPGRSLFNRYLRNNEFVGADLARKFLQMGYTRARRYANYAGGKKYDKNKNYQLLKKGTGDQLKEKSAEIFFDAWQKAKNNSRYKKLKAEWRLKFK